MEPIDRINHMLALRGMTGAELTRSLGLSTAVYSQWNTKATKPSKKNLLRVAECLGVSLEYLLYGNEDEKKPVQTDELSKKKQAILDEAATMNEAQLDRLLQLIKIAKQGI